MKYLWPIGFMGLLLLGFGALVLRIQSQPECRVWVRDEPPATHCVPTGMVMHCGIPNEHCTEWDPP